MLYPAYFHAILYELETFINALDKSAYTGFPYPADSADVASTARHKREMRTGTETGEGLSCTARHAGCPTHAPHKSTTEASP